MSEEKEDYSKKLYDLCMGLIIIGLIIGVLSMIISLIPWWW